MKAYKNQILLHFVILLWGFTGILGKLITLPSTTIVWYRILIAILTLLGFYLLKPFPIKLSYKQLFKLLGTGLVVGAHWALFFESIKVSNVSVALTALASTTLFTSILEPVLFKKKVVLYEMLFGLLVIIGLALIFNFESQYTLGIILALLSAFGAALFTVLNGRFISDGIAAKSITFYEMIGGLLGITIYMLAIDGFSIDQMITTNTEEHALIMDIIYLLLLGIVCTAFAFVIGVAVMKELSPFTVSISVNMEPIYSILLALLIFGEEEEMTPGFYLGGVLIMSTIFANAIIKRRLRKKAQQETLPT